MKVKTTMLAQIRTVDGAHVLAEEKASHQRRTRPEASSSVFPDQCAPGFIEALVILGRC
jgi:hypothetical protein